MHFKIYRDRKEVDQNIENRESVGWEKDSH